MRKRATKSPPVETALRVPSALPHPSRTNTVGGLYQGAQEVQTMQTHGGFRVTSNTLDPQRQGDGGIYFMRGEIKVEVLAEGGLLANEENQELAAMGLADQEVDGWLRNVDWETVRNGRFFTLKAKEWEEIPERR